MIADRNRAVTSALTYALVVAIVVTLTGALLFGAESYVTAQRQQAVQDQLDVVGQRLAATLSTADRLTTTDGAVATTEVTRRFPAVLAGSQYTITVDDVGGGTYRLALTASDLDISSNATVHLDGGTTLDETTINGGAVQVVYDPSADELEVRSAPS